MLYLFYGEDTKNSRLLISKEVHRLSLSPELLQLEGERITEEELETLARTRPLFEESPGVLLLFPFEHKETKDLVESKLTDLASSETHFFILEREMEDEALNLIKATAEKVAESKGKPGFKKEFNIFSLTDALLERDKKKLWVLYREALSSSIEPEEAHRILLWQVKNLGLVAGEKGPTGLKPFVEGKTKRALSKFSPTEIKELLQRLVDVQVRARNGRGEFETGLEKLILTL